MGQEEGKSKKVKGKKYGRFSASLRLCGLFLLLTAYCLPLTAQSRDYTRYVNPFIGTGGHGHTFPGATMPFGMVQLSPDTRIDNWDGSSGYHYSDDLIYGFSHTHLSGTGIPDGCDILLMPTLDWPQFFSKEGDKASNGDASKFSHASEKAEPGYYSVKLDDDGILAEMTATQRVGLHRYTFPAAKSVKLLIDMKWRDKTIDSRIELARDQVTLEGYRSSSSWAKDQKVYFVMKFSKRATDRPTWQENWIVESQMGWARQGDNFRAALGFRSDDKPSVLLVKVAISYVSIEGARKNLEAELPHWDFDKVRADAKAAWNKELSKIEVSGGTPEQTTNFYTALYHTMIHPNVFNDVDGKYKGHDGKMHQLPNFPLVERRSSASPKTSNPPRGYAAVPERRQSRDYRKGSARKSEAFPLGEKNRAEHYTVFSLWDTFRAAHPLYTIIDQKRTVDYINSFIRIYEQGGRLPVWELWGEETDTMIGYHAVSVIADAMAKGIKGFDYEKAYAAAKHSAELDHFGLAAYKRRGYISMEDENESVSKTLEYAYNDWCLGQIAYVLLLNQDHSKAFDRKLGYSDPKSKKLEKEILYFRSRSRYFENLFDTRTGFFRPKKNGGFVEPFAPNEVTFGFTEGNSWQYSFFVPHDVTRMMELMGGREKFVAKLDELFTTDQKLAGREQADLTGLLGQYAHGNEPSHHIAYLYNYAGEPWKTQRYVRRIMDEFYRNSPDGLIGNEDCGQMSAWYVLSASGFYPVLPGQTRYDLGTPIFKEVTYRLENGKKFTIRAQGVSFSHIYIKSARWNGQPYPYSYISHEQLASGGVLDLEMSSTPDDRWFAGHSSTGHLFLDQIAVPVITGERTFAERTSVILSTITPGAKIFYTTDGSVPSKDSLAYSAPFTLDRSTTVKAVAVGPNGTASFPVQAILTRRPHDWTVKVVSGYSTQYTGGGDNGIIDGIRGTVNFASGEWQGIQGKTYEAVIDLQKETTVTKVGGGFLQVASPWIWMPSNIKFEISNNGSDWSEVANIKTDVAVTDMKPQIRDYVTNITPVTARYVRIRAHNIGKIPSWHPGAGGDPWIFVDEIFIQ